MSLKISGKIEGLGQVLQNLDELRKSVRRRVLRKGINAATQPLLRIAKSLVPIRFGLLKKAMGRSIKAYRDSGNIIGIIGTRTDFATEVDGQRVDPAKYAHLVEFGHGGPHPAPAHPFLRPAFDAGRTGAMSAMKAKILEEIEAEARKLPKGKK